MDPTSDVSDIIREDPFAALAAKQRFESFRLGKGLPSSHTTPNFSKQSHVRHTSISSSVSTPSLSTSASSNKSTNDVSPSSKRPNSHHRRHSSVSTRRESADMMGVAEPDLPASSSDDNINLGDKDSIRRRALWALEGKPDISYSKVEIPEFASPEVEKKTFDFPTRPSYPPSGSGAGFGGSLNALLAKRDSFKHLSSSSSKDQLHTLVEEEEEEECVSEPDVLLNTPNGVGSAVPIVTETETKPSSRPRPAKLSLRPLSLTPDNLVSKSHGLPTPPPSTGSLKSLALAPSAPLKSHPSTNSSDDLSVMNLMNRQSLIHTPSPTPPVSSYRRPSPLHILCDIPSSISPEDSMPKRRSSISYKNSQVLHHSTAGLPTPDLTPTSDHRFSTISSSSTDDDFVHSRALSASEQHFLFKSHNALLSRITDLERALSSRSRPLSCASDVSSNATSEPSDEMLQLLADLKAERDELKRDVDGWRTRVNDLEKQISIYSRRVEAERRDAWVARSRAGLVEIEKTALEKALGEKTTVAREALRQCEELKDECNGLRVSLEKMQLQVKETEAECTRLRMVYEEETKGREELDLMATPTARAFDVQVAAHPVEVARRDSTADSESSTTDVESVDGLRLKAVIEEDNVDIDDEVNELLRYEDEEDSDISFESLGGSSCDSFDSFIPRSRPHSGSPTTHPIASNIPRPAVRRPTHVPHSSLSQTWTFPKTPQTVPIAEREEIDHFFGCLEDSPPLQPSAPTCEASKGLFSQLLSFGSDVDGSDMPPFLLPCDVGVEVVDVSKPVLDVVLEEEGEEEEITGDIEVGGIKFVFTPPQPDNPPADAQKFDYSPPAPIRKPVPVYEPFDEDDDHELVPFNFDRLNLRQIGTETPPYETRTESSRKITATSSIPRVTGLKPQQVSSNKNGNGTLAKSTLGRFIPPSGIAASNCVTPPSKRGGTIPSFIPQPVSNVMLPKRTSPTSIYIPQPPRKPASGGSGDRVSSSNASNVNDAMKTPRRFSESTPRASSCPTSEINHAVLTTTTTTTDNYIPPHEYPKGQGSPSPTFSSIMSSPFATRLATFIPLSWATSQVKPVAAAALCLISESSSAGSATDDHIGGPTSTQDTICNGFERRERKYVSKEQQLEKLRNRLHLTEHASDMCQQCQDEVVSL